jgi:hypothetical protein
MLQSRESVSTSNSARSFAALARKLVRQGDTVIDIGARNGVCSSLVAAGLVGDTGYVVAVENDPAHFARLRANTSLGRHNNVYCLHLSMEGISDTLPVLRLDKLCETLERVALIRINAPGAELDLLRRVSNRITEANPPSLVFHLDNSSPHEANLVTSRIADLFVAKPPHARVSRLVYPVQNKTLSKSQPAPFVTNVSNWEIAHASHAAAYPSGERRLAAIATTSASF